jgi:DNA topoisomerase VI subunit B
LQGLQTLSGVSAEELDKFIVKELVDNALDAGDEQHSGPCPIVPVSSTVKDGMLELRVSDNAFGVNEEAIQKIADLTRKYSSRFGYKYPTRGSMGHAWKIILGATHALWKNASNKNQPEYPIIIYNHETRNQYVLRLEYDEEARVVLDKSVVVEEEVGEPTGTTVTVRLPLYRPEWANSNRHLGTIFEFALFNPHVLLTYNGERFPPLTNKDLHSKIRESIHWFSFEEFHQRVKATAKDYPETTLSEFIQGFRGFSGFHQCRKLLNRPA